MLSPGLRKSINEAKAKFRPSCDDPIADIISREALDLSERASALRQEADALDRAAALLYSEAYGAD